MATTYDGNPATNSRNKVRFKTGDVGTTHGKFPFILTDEEIDWVITQKPDLDIASADCCDSIAAKIAGQIANKGVSGNSRSVFPSPDFFHKLGRTLRNARLYAADILVGGSSVADNLAMETDADLVQPAFKIGMDDYPGGALTDHGWSDVGSSGNKTDT